MSEEEEIASAKALRLDWNLIRKLSRRRKKVRKLCVVRVNAGGGRDGLGNVGFDLAACNPGGTRIRL